MYVSLWKSTCMTFNIYNCTDSKRYTRNHSNSTNYRVIALGSLFCKMFDNIILDKHYVNLMSDDRLQFGYKKVHLLYYVLHY